MSAEKIIVKALKKDIILNDYEIIEEKSINIESRRNILGNKAYSYSGEELELKVKIKEKIIILTKIREIFDTFIYNNKDEKISENRKEKNSYFSKMYYDENGNLKDSLLEIL